MRIQGGEIPARGGVAERLVWSDGIVVLLPGVQRLLQRWQVEVLRITLPELPPRGAVEALDPAVELGRAGRQHIEGDPSVLAGLLELGHELRSAIDLERLHRERHPGYEFVEKGQRRARWTRTARGSRSRDRRRRLPSIRPIMEALRIVPRVLSRWCSLSLPIRGYCCRNARTACSWAAVQVARRTRVGRRERGSSLVRSSRR